MRRLFTPDIFASLFIAAILIAVVAFVAWPLADQSIWRLFLIAAAPAIPELARVALKVPAVRLLVHRVAHRLSGPVYEVQAGGMIWTTSSDSEATLLDRGLTIAKKVYSNAKVETSLTNRVMIKAGRSRTVRIDLPQELQHGCGEEENDRRVEFLLWGYDGKATRIEKLLEKEIAPFIDELTKAMQNGGESRNFWLRIHTQGQNPFLQFYLRDVPDAEVSNFQLELTDIFAGDLIKVSVQQDGFRVTATTPFGLASSAKAYLATPALSHRHRG